MRAAPAIGLLSEQGSNQIPAFHRDLVQCSPVAALADGSPQTSVVWCDFNGDCVRVNTMRGFAKERNMRRNPRVTLLCYDLKGAQTGSCSSVVLMEESAEQVASTHGARVIFGADGRPGRRIWWSQPECPVGTVAVVMLDMDPEDLLQVAAANDQQPVQALGADGPNPALGVGVGLWRPDWGHQDVGVL